MVPQRTGIAPEPQTVVFSRETTPTQDWAAGFQRFLMTLFGCVVLLCCAVTMLGCLYFASSLFSAVGPILFVGLISMAADAFKAVLPMIIHSLQKRETVLTSLAWLGFVICFGWSIICGTGAVFMLADSAYQAGAATSGAALFVLMLIAQGGSALGPVLIVTGMRHAKDLPDEEPPVTQAPQQMDMGLLEPAGDGISEWLREVVSVQPGAQLQLIMGYDHYVTFCKMRGHNPVKYPRFVAAVKMHGKALTGLDVGRDKSTYVPGISMAGAEKPPLLRIAN